jgi:hypothetical protein
MRPPGGCICRHPNARECYALRHPPVPFDDYADDDWPEGEVCECSCHDLDQDGYDGWGDRHEDDL